MATHDYNLANQDGASFRSDLNNALSAIVSNNSSSTAPATTFAHQIWVDTTANVIKQRNAANDAWIELWRIDGGFNAKTFSSNVTLNAQSDLRFADSDSSNWVAFQAPATVSSNVTWTLPASDGTSGQVIETNGSGVLSWADAGGVTDNITEGNTSAEVVDTGSDGHFKVVTEGTEALRVNASQNVGFGTISPTNRIHSYASNDAGRTDHIRLQNDGASNGTESAIIFTQNSATEQACIFSAKDATGPSLNIEISGAQMGRFTNNGQFIVGTVPSSLPTSTLVVEGASDGTDGNPVLHFSRKKTIGSATALGAITFGKNNLQGARIYGISNGTWTESSAHPTDLVFETVPNSSTTLTTAAKILKGGEFQFNSGFGSVATAYGVRAWASWSGQGTVALQGSGNVSSITDNGTGDYTINFSSSMPDGAYQICGNVLESTSGGRGDHIFTIYRAARQTGSVRVNTVNLGGTAVDDLSVWAAIIR